MYPHFRTHLKLFKRAQRNNFPKLHLYVHRYTSEYSPEELFLNLKSSLQSQVVTVFLKLGFSSLLETELRM